MGRNCRAIVAAAGLVLIAAGVDAQTPRFEAASVKRNTSGSENGARNLGAGGRLVFTNMTLDRVIAAAYEIEQHQLLSAPRWTSTERFDIIATAGTAAPLPQLYAMLRTLLAERFRLTVHTEERVVPSYVLSRARADGRLGSALKPATANCGPTGRGSGPAPSAGCSAWMGPGTVGFAGQPIANLARALGMMLQQPVVDRTGLEGGYDIDLKFSSENLPGIPTGPPGGPGAAVDPNTPTIFAALQEQLGLRLEAQRAPIQVVIVDSVSMPTDDR
jgi:uncharacterized protein (TIGR03435 family)